MRSILGMALVGALWLGTGSAANAQFSMSIGNPYGGGLAIGNGYYGSGYGGYGGYGSNYYSSGYGGLGYGSGSIQPGIANYYGSGYSGYTTPYYGVPYAG